MITPRQKQRAEQISKRLSDKFPAVFLVRVWYNDEGHLLVYLRPRRGGRSSMTGFTLDHVAVEQAAAVIELWVRDEMKELMA